MVPLMLILIRGESLFSLPLLGLLGVDSSLAVIPEKGIFLRVEGLLDKSDGVLTRF